VSVKAHQTYYKPARTFLPEKPEAQRHLQHAHDDVLDLSDVVGKRLIDTRLKPKITIREENAIAALEVMSRFASDPKWLIYLPPTMAPTETSKHENLLEHPDEALAFYRKEGITTVVCEQKHMGSRAVVAFADDLNKLLLFTVSGAQKILGNIRFFNLELFDGGSNWSGRRPHCIEPRRQRRSPIALKWLCRVVHFIFTFDFTTVVFR
jgi:hypothetical protein